MDNKKEITVKEFLFTIFLFLILIGCATESTYRLESIKRSGVNQDKFERDKYECYYRSRQICPDMGGPLAEALCFKPEFDKCMKAFGYSK